MKKEPILKVEDLCITFSQYTTGLHRKDLEVISKLNLELYAGEILAIVGASGSGKSLLANSILGILPENAEESGNIYFDGVLLDQKKKESLRGKKISLIPQSVNYLDPLLRVGKQIEISMSGKKGKSELIKTLFEKYHLPVSTMECFPFQLSGGMARKVLLATALMAEPDVIIADEPTPGLDEKSLDEVLKDFREIANEGKGVLMITHDIEAALRIADKIAVFYAGTTIETLPCSDLIKDGLGPRHPYTNALDKARPHTDFQLTKGTQPYPDKRRKGCIFSDHCPLKKEECSLEMPSYRDLRGGKVRCINAT